MLVRLRTIAAVGLLLAVAWPIHQAELAAQAGPAQRFVDPIYHYSLEFPRTWKTEPPDAAAERTRRVSLLTPHLDRVEVFVSVLPITVKRGASLQTIGEQYVNPVIERYRKGFRLLSGLSDTADHSDGASMRLWQGTSTLHESGAPAMLLSLHAIKYGSSTMVNVVYVSVHQSQEEVREVDRVMDSLAFDAR